MSALPAGVRYLSPKEITARRLARGGTAERSTRRLAATARRARAAASGISIPTPAIPHLSDLTPRGFTQYAADSTTKVPAALLLLAVIAGIRFLRRGSLPSAEETAGLLIAAVIVAVLASFVPELVALFLLATLIAVALDATPAINAATAWLSGLLSGSSRPVAAPLPVPGASRF